jgi:AAA domain
MDAFTDDFHSDGSLSEAAHDQFAEKNSGKPFDDQFLILKGYRRKAYYNFVLADDTLLYQQNRYELNEGIPPSKSRPEKRFLPSRPVNLETFDRERNIGEKVFGAGARRVIYNWPAIMRAGPGATVFVTEGEKNATDLIDAGLLATTVISHRWTRECVAALVDYHLIILEDHDDSGRKIAAAARGALSRVAKSTRIVPFIHLWNKLNKDKGPPENGDVSDWIYYGGDPQQLLGICEEIPAGGVIEAQPYQFPEEHTLEPWDFLYGYHYQRDTVSVTAASGGTGKSTKGVGECLAMVSGKPLLGVKPLRRLRVCLINLEDNRAAMDKRIFAAKKHYGLTDEDIGDRLILIAKGELTLKIAALSRKTLVEHNEEAIKGLIDFLIKNEIDVLSIDPLRKTHRVPENLNTEMGEVIEAFERVAEAAHVAIHIWHHTRKGNGTETTVDSIRGAAAIIDAARSAEVMETMTKDEAKKCKIEERERFTFFRTFNGKLNFAPRIDRSDWFKIENVTLRENDDNIGFGIDVGVVTRWEHPGAQTADLTPGTIDQIKAKVGTEPFWREHQLSATWVGKAIAPIVGLDPDDDVLALKGTIKRLLDMRALKTVPGRDPERRKPTMFVIAENQGSD